MSSNGPQARPLPKHRLQRKLQLGIERVLLSNPFWQTEGIRINGPGGMAAALKRIHIKRRPATIREAIRRMGLKTVGFGMVAANLPSRERLLPIIQEVVDARPEWKTGFIKVRGKNGIKEALKARGYNVNQVIIRRGLVQLGLHPWPHGTHHAAKL